MRRLFTFLIGLLLVTPTIGVAEQSVPEKQAAILVLTVDDLRRTYLRQILARGALASLKARGDETSETSTSMVPIAAYTKMEFDSRQLVRWQIPESSLPPGSSVLYRQPNLWRDQRALVIASIAVVATQTLLIVGLVTEYQRRHRAELESRRGLATIAHLDRRGAMGELASSLAHELNQPLNAILQNAGAAHMMLTSSSSPPPMEEIVAILADIQRDDVRAGEVIRRMHGLLRKHEPTLHPVDLNALVHDTMALVQHEAVARSIQVTLDLSQPLDDVRGDHVHLQQVLLNLLLNAMDAVADLAPDRRRVRVETNWGDADVELSVLDRGKGIAANPTSQVFEAFYSTKAKGMGMGLAISHRIIEMHAGSMQAENNVEGGATVRFRIPAGGRA